MSHTYGQYSLDNSTPPFALEDIGVGMPVAQAIEGNSLGNGRCKAIEGHDYKTSAPMGIAVYGAGKDERIEVAVSGIVNVSCYGWKPGGMSGASIFPGDFLYLGTDDEGNPAAVSFMPDYEAPVSGPGETPGKTYVYQIGQALGGTPAQKHQGTYQIPVNLNFAKIMLVPGA